MTYTEAVDFLFSATPVFQNVGGSAYKPGLERMQALDAHYGYPHQSYRTVHVGGTNGKGSTSHTLAAILQSAGYKVGLFTSPHLIDFRERIRVNGQMISEEYVCRFTEEAKSLVSRYQPSFFELTSMMAFKYFADEAVDVAIIEVGLGGRLDSTNIIRPVLSIITNISYDHTQYLGTTLEEIAREKAGIMKPCTPVVIGQARDQDVRKVFTNYALAIDASITFADEEALVLQTEWDGDGYYHYSTAIYGEIDGSLGGEAQKENTATILSSIRLLAQHFVIPRSAIQQGFAKVSDLTGLLGRWQTLSFSPRIVCDTGHNEAGVQSVLRQIALIAPKYRRVHIVLGVASDKDVRSMLRLFPQHYDYHFTRASVARALDEGELQHIAQGLGLIGRSYPSVAQCLEAVLSQSDSKDLIFIGGSNFIVADLLLYWNKQNNK